MPVIISSGWAKGLALKTPKGDTTRPTSARVRGAILNTLAPWLDEAMVLDLFGGSGALGIEALSRGARGAIFIERDKLALAALRPNVAELQRRAKAQDLPLGPVEVVPGDVAQLVVEKGSLRRWGAFDVIFADPPYANAAMWADVLLRSLPSITARGGILVFETALGEGADALLRIGPEVGWEVLKQKAYGDTMVTVLSFLGP
jgi:16S rRNA (guanine(966)-N(2))-methyltransferase RsmD